VTAALTALAFMNAALGNGAVTAVEAEDLRLLPVAGTS
jgi:hypothetical protein